MRNKFKNPKAIPSLILLFLLGSATATLSGQQRISPEDALDIAYQNNLQYAVNSAQINKADIEVKTKREIPKTGFFLENEVIRPSNRTGAMQLAITQTIQWPGVYHARKKVYEEQAKYFYKNKNLLDAVIRKEVNSAYYQLWYLQEVGNLYNKLDEYYTSMYKAANLRFKTGEAAGLESIAAEARMEELRAQFKQNFQNISAQQKQLGLFLNTPTEYLPLNEPLKKLAAEDLPTDSLHPSLSLQQQNIEIAKADINVQKMQNKPDFSGRIFSQSILGVKDPITGFSVGAEIPIFGKSAYKSKIQVAEAEVQLQQQQLVYQQTQLSTQKQTAYTEILKAEEMLKFYEGIGLKQADQIFDAAMLSYRAGEIGFSEMYQFFTQAIDIRKNYLVSLNDYNQAVINYNYYTGK